MVKAIRWHKRTEKLTREDVTGSPELLSRNLKKLAQGSPLSVFDFIQEDEGGRFLKKAGVHYRWLPAGSPETCEEHPISSLLTVLVSLGAKIPILAPLDVYSSKAEFLYGYGLEADSASTRPARSGITFRKFKELVMEGQIILYLAGGAYRYRPDFYREIFDACEKAGYSPIYPSARFSTFMALLRLRSLADQERVPREEGWAGVMLARHPRYSLERMREQTVKISSSKSEVEYHATRLVELNVWGYEEIADLCDRVAGKDKQLAYALASGFTRFLIDPVVGFCGLEGYDQEDLAVSRFLGIPREMLPVTPLDFRLVREKGVEVKAVWRPDRGEVKRVLERGSDRKPVDAFKGIQQSAWRYDLKEVMRHHERLSSYLTDYYNKEMSGWFKKSKVVSYLTYCSVGALVGATLVLYKNAGWMSLPAFLHPEAVKVNIELSKWLASKWPFKEKGLPFLLFRHDIPPPKKKLT